MRALGAATGGYDLGPALGAAGLTAAQGFSGEQETVARLTNITICTNPNRTFPNGGIPMDLTEFEDKVPDIIHVLDKAMALAEPEEGLGAITRELTSAKSKCDSAIHLGTVAVFDAGEILDKLLKREADLLRQHPKLQKLICEAEHKAAHVAISGEPTHKHCE